MKNIKVKGALKMQAARIKLKISSQLKFDVNYFNQYLYCVCVWGGGIN